MELDVDALSHCLKIPDTALGTLDYKALNQLSKELERHVHIATELRTKVEEFRIAKSTNIQPGMCVVFGSELVYLVKKVAFGTTSQVSKCKLFIHAVELRLSVDGDEVVEVHPFIVSVNNLGPFQRMSYEEGVSVLRKQFREWQSYRTKTNGQKKT